MRLTAVVAKITVGQAIKWKLSMKQEESLRARTSIIRDTIKKTILSKNFKHQHHDKMESSMKKKLGV